MLASRAARQRQQFADSVSYRTLGSAANPRCYAEPSISLAMSRTGALP